MENLKRLALMAAMAVISPIRALQMAFQTARLKKDVSGISDYMIFLVVVLVIAALAIAYVSGVFGSATEQTGKLENKIDDLIDNLSF